MAVARVGEREQNKIEFAGHACLSASDVACCHPQPSRQIRVLFLLFVISIKMGSRGEKDKQKQIQDKCQTVLNAMLRDEDNKYCVDCDSKGPRWASWNLGVFLCIRCAGIHRNLGVHISKVKSVNLDSWTPEQVVSLQQMGNSRARAVYEANLPDNFRRPQSDSSLESFIRAKYEHKKYIAREWVPPVIPKVDWEKEIDEEMERQKRKKKSATVVDKKPLKIAEVPQIPKPKTSASPKPARSTVPVEKTTQDLLGLQNGEDGFSGFLSATTAKEEEGVDAAKAEEESFFNQPAPTEKEKSKLTKDSILALYGSAPTQPVYNPAFQPQAPVFGQGYQFPAQGFPAQPFPQQTYPLQNGMPQQFQQFQTSTPAQFPASQPQFPQQGQFAGAQGQFPGAQPPFAQNFPANTQTQFGAPMQFPQFANFAPSQQFGPQSAPFQAFPGAQPAPNPFGAAPAGLPQQFGSLSLGAQIPGAKAPQQPPVATNLWQ